MVLDFYKLWICFSTQNSMLTQQKKFEIRSVVQELCGDIFGNH